MRGVVWCLIWLIAQSAYAYNWRNWWWTPDQQAQQLMQQGQFSEAAKQFHQPDWKAVAAYRAGDYDVSAQQFAGLNTAQGLYNSGNALAKAGHLPEALKAYDQALKINPQDQDAVANRKLVADLIKQNQNQKPNNSQQQDKSQQEQSNPTQKQESRQTNNDSGQSQNQPASKDNQDQQDNSNQQAEQDKSRDETDQSAANKPEKTDDAEAKSDKPESPLKSEAADQDEAAKESSPSPAQTAGSSASEQEKQQAKQQWLHLIPDDPGGLLRQKFLRDYRRQQQVQPQ